MYGFHTIAESFDCVFISATGQCTAAPQRGDRRWRRDARTPQHAPAQRAGAGDAHPDFASRAHADAVAEATVAAAAATPVAATATASHTVTSQPQPQCQP